MRGFPRGPLADILSYENRHRSGVGSGVELVSEAFETALTCPNCV
jgi:hypothetical protein